MYARAMQGFPDVHGIRHAKKKSELLVWYERHAKHALARRRLEPLCWWQVHTATRTQCQMAFVNNNGRCGPHTCASGQLAPAPMFIALLNCVMSRLDIPYGARVNAVHKWCTPRYVTCITGGACAYQAKHTQSIIIAQTQSFMCER